MGNWHISIQGTGAHHNKISPTDANRMAAELVAALRKAGHSVNVATFTYGGADDIAEDNIASPFYAPLHDSGDGTIHVLDKDCPCEPKVQDVRVGEP